MSDVYISLYRSTLIEELFFFHWHTYTFFLLSIIEHIQWNYERLAYHGIVVH